MSDPRGFTLLETLLAVSLTGVCLALFLPLRHGGHDFVLVIGTVHAWLAIAVAHKAPVALTRDHCEGQEGP